jgi:hypothetical protein
MSINCALKIPICIICNRPLTAKYDEVQYIDPTQKPTKVLIGYECKPCRDMNSTDINRALIDSIHSMEAAEIAYKYKRWSDRYKEVLAVYDKVGLPEGFSFP